jgi:hypothetical protein
MSIIQDAAIELLAEIKTALPGVPIFEIGEVVVDKSVPFLVGSGAFGSAFKATLPSQNNRLCAAQMFSTNEIAPFLAKNARLFLKDPHMVEFIGVTVDNIAKPRVVLLWELTDGDLSMLMDKNFSTSKFFLASILGPCSNNIQRSTSSPAHMTKSRKSDKRCLVVMNSI